MSRNQDVGLIQCWVAFPIFTVLLSALATLGSEIDYGYGDTPIGPDHWASLSPAWKLCGDGKEQSPIYINTSSAVLDIALGRLNFSFIPSAGILSNSGHDIEVDFEPGAGRLVIGEDVYGLTRFHFHAPSEHVIQNVRFPLELHMVHVTADGLKVAVVGIVFAKGKRSHFLEKLWSHLPRVTEKGSNSSIGIVSLKHLHMGISYARYRGSLTVPPCTQGLNWNVHLSEGNTVSQAQLDALAKVLNGPNARPLQLRNGREVDRYPSSTDTQN